MVDIDKDGDNFQNANLRLEDLSSTIYSKIVSNVMV